VHQCECHDDRLRCAECRYAFRVYQIASHCSGKSTSSSTGESGPGDLQGRHSR
jgi:hypothetical protein